MGITVFRQHRTPGAARAAVWIAALALTLGAGSTPAPTQARKPVPGPAAVIARQDLMEDVHALAKALETTHPDPYIRGGGKIAFHRRVHETLHAIPDEGMTAAGFHRLLLPLVAAVGDGHTSLWPPRGAERGPGLPFGFDIVEQTLYVQTVHDEWHGRLLGARLASVAGVPYRDLLERQKRLAGWDNEYHLVTHLVQSLDSLAGLELLLADALPEAPGDRRSLDVGFLLPSGETITLSVQLTGRRQAPLRPPSAVTLPSMERRDFNYGFLDEERRTALLKIDGMTAFRESFELMEALGVGGLAQQAKRVYGALHDRPAPEDLAEILAGIPAATDVFRALAIDMKEAGTTRLIVDLRRNGGGNSVMANILLYFLYGAEAASDMQETGSIARYSDLFFEQFPERTLEEINQDRRVPVGRGGYDFRHDPFTSRQKQPDAALQQEVGQYLRMMPTFLREFESGAYAGHYLPAEVVVLSSPWTYSSGFMLMSMLYRRGATIVGVPSGQAGNCFGDTLYLRLPHSGLGASISYKKFVAFPDDPERGRVLRPHRELTYDMLRQLGFDPNAAVLMAR